MPLLRVISLTNQKGGVGKTTTAVNLGVALNNLGRKVLIVDVDPQGNATTHLGINPDSVEASVYDIMRGEVAPKDARIEVRAGLDLIPSNIELSGAEIDLVNTIGRERLLKDALSRIRAYEYILVDCPPSLGLLTINALVASKEVFIILQPEFFALKGVRKLIDTVDLVKSRMNRGLTISGVVVCLYDKRRNLCKEVTRQIRAYFGHRAFRTVIHDNVALAEAPIKGKDIFSYQPKSRGALDYDALSREVDHHGQKKVARR